MREQRREYSKKNRAYFTAKTKEWRKNNKEKVAVHNIKGREWCKNNPQNVRAMYDRKYAKDRKNPQKILINRLRLRIYTFLRERKSESTMEIVGCSISEFKDYIGNKFSDGMSWENIGEWHIDHIYPLSLAKDTEHIKSLCHYTNLQPMWASDNIRKGNKLVP